MPTVRQHFGVSSRFASKDFIAGLECEIENIDFWDDKVAQSGVWDITEDGSLRDSGREFISTPLPKDRLLETFDALHNLITYKSQDKTKRFSPRTSIHVHINCLDLETDSTKSIALWYALFEPIFFLMVDPSRRNNIHCVGLDQTCLSESYNRPLNTMVQRWSKYTALNLIPLASIGTMEFRHMQGTDNVETLREWLNALENLWLYGQQNFVNMKAIKDDNAVQEAFKSIFKDSPSVLKYSGMLPELLSDSLLDIKLSFN